MARKGPEQSQPGNQIEPYRRVPTRQDPINPASFLMDEVVIPQDKSGGWYELTLDLPSRNPLYREFLYLPDPENKE